MNFMKQSRTNLVAMLTIAGGLAIATVPVAANATCYPSAQSSAPCHAQAKPKKVKASKCAAAKCAAATCAAATCGAAASCAPKCGAAKCGAKCGAAKCGPKA